jgi:hypothetical protein
VKVSVSGTEFHDNIRKTTVSDFSAIILFPQSVIDVDTACVLEGKWAVCSVSGHTPAALKGLSMEGFCLARSSRRSGADCDR